MQEYEHGLLPDAAGDVLLAGASDLRRFVRRMFARQLQPGLRTDGHGSRRSAAGTFWRLAVSTQRTSSTRGKDGPERHTIRHHATNEARRLQDPDEVHTALPSRLPLPDLMGYTPVRLVRDHANRPRLRSALLPVQGVSSVLCMRASALGH